MKKVLALVLAVVMICTMAMAVTTITITGSDGTIVVSGSDTVATATIANDKAIKSNTTYYLEVPEGFFKVLTDNGVNIGTKKYGEVFTVSGLNGGFNAADLSKYYVPVKVKIRLWMALLMQPSVPSPLRRMLTTMLLSR